MGQLTEVASGLHFPEGPIAMPDGSVIVVEMLAPRLTPGELAPAAFDDSNCLYGFPGLQLLDSLAIDGAGNVCVGTLVNGGVSVASPDGELVEFVAVDDSLTTNICFGGDDLRTAYVTASSTGRLLQADWPRPGARLHHLNT